MRQNGNRISYSINLFVYQKEYLISMSDDDMLSFNMIRNFARLTVIRTGYMEHRQQI